MEKLKFSIGGTPKGKGRPRATARIAGTRAFVSMYTPEATRRAEAMIAKAFKAAFPRHRPFTGPVMLRFTAVFETPESFTKEQKQAARRGELYHTSKPDKDNIEKLVKDALNGLAWIDDSQAQGGGIKRYGTCERIDVVIEPLPSIGSPADRRREAALKQRKLF